MKQLYKKEVLYTLKFESFVYKLDCIGIIIHIYIILDWFIIVIEVNW
jgi:hypothetical protein